MDRHGDRFRDDDEGPSEDDLARFSDGDAYCPDCGSEVHDTAEVCPRCYAYLGGDVSRFRPVERDLRSRFIAATAIAIALVLLGWLVW